jgi:exopolyphosphatase / guanosine-5'-triphosphate,3'-diphosphate pyrophosphatase
MDRPVAAIDIGTNTLLLLVASRDGKGILKPLADVHRVPRLGAGVDARRQLRSEAIARVITALKEFQRIARTNGAESIVACATSAVRDAGNREEFLEEVRNETGLSIEVLSGEDEALWSFRGAATFLPQLGRATVLDIGGGSTEIIWGIAPGITGRVSLNIGAVRLTERCFHHDPPLPSEIELASLYVNEALDTVAHQTPPGDAQLIAVAGTPTTLATLAQGLKSFSREHVEGYIMNRAAVEKLWDTFLSFPSPEIRKMSEVLEGRADVITAGTLVLRRVMDRFGFASMTVSDRGLRYGLVLREFQRISGAIDCAQ